MIKLRDSNGNVSTIQDDGEMLFDDKKVEDDFKKAEEKMNIEVKDAKKA